MMFFGVVRMTFWDHVIFYSLVVFCLFDLYLWFFVLRFLWRRMGEE